MKILLMLLACAGLGLAQTASVNSQTVRFRLLTGTSAPSSGACDASSEVGSVYVRTGDQATVPDQAYRCKKTGASSYAWGPFGYAAQAAGPATCAVGEVWFDTDATAGSNWYGCTSANTYTLLGGGGGGGSSDPASLNCGVTRTSSTILTMFTSASSTTPCVVTIGNKPYSFTSPATATISAGSITAYIYVSSAGTATVASSSGTIVGSGLTVVTASAFPVDAYQMWTWTSTSGTWDTSGGTQVRSFMTAAPKFTAGSNVTLTQTADELTIAASGGGATPIFTTTGTGSYWPFGAPGFGTATVPIASTNDTWFVEFISPGTMTWKTIGGTQNADDSGKHYAWAIYDSSCNLIQQTSTRTSTANTGYQIDFASPISATAGVYYAAYTSDSTTISQSGAFGGSDLQYIGNAGAVKRVFKGSSSTGTSTLTFPSTCGTRNNPGTAQLVFFALFP